MLPIFPEFAVLTLDDKDKYNQLVAKYPPISDIAFTTLHIWWNLDGKLSISSLNGNLVINYNLPFDEDSSGLCLIGKQQVDDSIQAIFEYLHHHKKPVKLVHVPEFVVEEIKHKQSLTIEEELDYHEYIIDSKAVATLEGHDHSRTRRKVNRFLREAEGRQVEVKTLDLSIEETKEMLFKTVMEWHDKYPGANDPDRTEDTAIKNTLGYSLALDTQNLCLFVDGKLHGVVLYHRAIDEKHFIINHLKVDYGIPFTFDYLTNQLAVKAVKEGIPFLNMEMDLGIEGLRRHKMGLRPIGFFKKYTVALNK